MKNTALDLDDLIEEITVDANGEGEQLWAFRKAFEDSVPLPCAAEVMGEPVQALKFDFDGNERRGLTAMCLRPNGTNHVVAACDLMIPPTATGGRHLAAYRKWMGLAPFPKRPRAKTGRVSQPVAPHLAPVLNGAVELVVLSVKGTVARCRMLDGTGTLTLRGSGPLTMAPAEIAVVRPTKLWTYQGSRCVSGSIESTRLDVPALKLEPLGLEQCGFWDPAEHYWGEKGEPIEKWARPIIARGRRAEFEMEQVIPGQDPDDFDSDPIIESNDHKDSGDVAGAHRILMELCHSDLRCLDAHNHLGNLVFDRRPGEALHHYEAGFRIGELSLGAGFEGVLSWGWIDNRPFLRCMHGFGLCLWRLRQFEEAAAIFNRMLWLNPSDNQGVRMMIDQVRKKERWDDCA